MELEALQQIYGEVRALGAQIVVLTPELERYTRALHKKLNLSFDILTDLHLKTAEQFRLVFTLPDYLRDLYKSFGNALDRFHDEQEYRLPMPARYVVDKQGTIRARCKRRLHNSSGAFRNSEAVADVNWVIGQH
jgi:peroxiredoxin